jgi:signal transduction histidine kinase/DNA-binding response OmpR family regulator
MKHRIPTRAPAWDATLSGLAPGLFAAPLALAADPADPAALALAALCGAGLYWFGSRRGRRAERACARLEETLAVYSTDAGFGLRPDTTGLSSRVTESLDHLHQLIQRTADQAARAQREREDAQIAAAAAGRARTEFLATMSHELRTPLNGSLGMLALLLDSDLSRDQQEFAMTAKRSCLSLLEMIDEVLDFATLENDRMTLERKPFKLVKTIWDAVVDQSAKAAHRGVGLSFQELDELPQLVLGDGARFRQVLDNLLDNAVKFTHEGEISLRARIVTRDAASLRIAFELSDTGVGIHECKLDHIFEAFAQADQSSTRRYGGAGLGLVIVKRLLERMDGSIDCEVDHGTTFRFDMVFALAESTADARAKLPIVEAGTRAVLCTTHPSFAEALGAQLNELGFTVETVMDPEIALNRRREDPPLLFLVDDNLPDIELHQLRRALDEEALPGGCVHALLHGPDDQQPHDGFHGHIDRPTRPSVLRPFLMRLCEFAIKAPLPAAQEAEAAPEQPKSKRVRYEGRVLVVEDNPVNLRVVTAQLEKRGIEVESATNGFEALSMLRLVRCDLVLMDVQMPEMDGIEATRRIRSGDAGPCLDVPIVALTAGDQPEDRSACHEAGMEDYIRKPLTELELDTVLSKWLRAVMPVED